MEKPFFNEHEEQIKTHFPLYSMEETETGIFLKFPQHFHSKTLLTVQHKKEVKQESSCIFCSKRVKCVTTNWKNCQGFELNHPFTYDFNDVISFFENFTTILYSKGV